MVIIVDVMGGDNAPEETVKGVYQASLECDAEFIIVGNKNDIDRISKENGLDLSKFQIVHTETVIEMNDDPLAVVRAKKDSSMSVGLQLLADGKGDAFVSTGSTGALFTGATLIVHKIKGVQRAAIAAILPLEKPVLLVDTGANAVVTEESLEQFAIMGSVYMEKFYGIKNPCVGLLNNGTEECKGTPLQVESYKKLSSLQNINFVGNIEGSALPFGACDVLVTDGFTGNILLKSIEGIGKLVFKSLKGIFYHNTFTKLAALAVKKPFRDFKKKFDSSEQGGAPLLGISKTVIKAHGSSNAKAFKNAVKQAILCAENNTIDEISTEMGKYLAVKKAQRAEKKAAEAELSEINQTKTNKPE